jgi:predicted PurR-regulated permease PerM
MGISPPTTQQAKVIWIAVTGLAVALLLSFLGLIFWGAAWAIGKLSSVLLPLAIAGILAYLLDPLVHLFERHGVPRQRAIVLVFLIGVALVLGAAATVLPRVFFELRALVDQLPAYAGNLSDRFQGWLQNSIKNSALASRLKVTWFTDLKAGLQSWLGNAAPAVSTWFVTQATRVASWFGFLVGFAMVPVYLFYLLLEKEGIRRSWTEYLPIRKSQAKEEIVFILEAINNYLIVFVRGQVLVALCDGALLMIGFLMLRMDYAVLLGISAAILAIVPFIGMAINLLLALALATVQFGDWLHPLLVLAWFGLVQIIEGFFISPKIIGDRVGLHPLTIILAVMIGTTLLGGIAGGILAIPLTAALRAVMARYIWKPPEASRIVTP